MTPLRQRMLEGTGMRKLASSTKNLHVSKAAQFAKHFNNPPDQLGAEEIRTQLLSLVRQEGPSQPVQPMPLRISVLLSRNGGPGLQA
jgi:hypothetical protein